VTARLRTPWLVCLATLALTAAATVFVYSTGRERDEARFDSAVQNAEDRIRRRIETYVALLDGTRAFFIGSDTVSARDFGRFVAALDVRRRYPGLLGVGFSRRLAPAETAMVLAARRRDGFPDFRLAPDSPRAELHAILFIEPLDERNRAALGFDMFTDSVRRAAMIRARDTGRPVLSGRVRLRQEIDADVQPGILVYTPLYRGGEAPPTVEERRAALLGFVYAPLRAGDLFTATFGPAARVGDGGAAAAVSHVAIRIFDGATTDSSALLFDSHAADGHGHGIAPVARRTRALTVGDRRLTVEYEAEREGGPLATSALALATALIGTLLAMVLFRLTAREAQARATAERSEAARTRFFAAMSHELRTPINAILGYDDLVLAEVYGPLNDAQRQAIERGQRAARHLLELVNDVLDMSKIEAGKIEIATERVDVAALVEDMMTTVVPMASERGCVLEREGATCPLEIETDPRRVRQILLNLLSNATKFGAGQPVTLRCGAQAGGVTFEVEDRGPGIGADDLPRIFEEFVQIGSVAEGGTGLGLPISRRLAELLGGRLEVESTPGRGSTFRLVLPERPRQGHGWTGTVGRPTIPR
jgi:signal transduction histidine kinase